MAGMAHKYSVTHSNIGTPKLTSTESVPGVAKCFGFVWYSVCILSKFASLKNLKLIASTLTDLWSFLRYLVWFGLDLYSFIWYYMCVLFTRVTMPIFDLDFS